MYCINEITTFDMNSLNNQRKNTTWTFEWVTEWQPRLVRIWTVSEVEICMSSRMTYVSGVYLYCIWVWNLNRQQNDIRVWSVSGLGNRSEWVTEWLPYLERIWTVSEVEICMSSRMTSVVWSVSETVTGIWISDIMTSLSGVYLDCIWCWDLYE